ncbi:MAG: mannose-6-phosphate isomerase [Planctomycetaceae bacterium]|nr:mannose-6-phosphate isomerase [Planctomycetaceae bacterium]
MNVIDIREKLNSFKQHWSPKVIAELNGQHVKVVKLLGEFDWHFHEHEDELFWVIRGTLVLHFRDKSVELKSGQMCVIPKTVEHKPVAKEECEVILFEPAGTLNTGNLDNERTVSKPEEI